MLLKYICSTHVLLEYTALPYLCEFNDDNLVSKPHTILSLLTLTENCAEKQIQKERLSLVHFGGFFPAS
jgi:hypothetical protein